jgi:beta-ureidopropionase / N-carbamoyl-L-amino-acid hydrolase
MSDSNLKAAAAVDQARLWRRLMRLAEIGATPAGGVNRQALSEEDTEAKRLLAAWAVELGFGVEIDEIGNLYVRRPGLDENAAPVVTGSHLDSQPTGGKFDGAYGVMAGFEALEALQRAGIETRRPVEVVAWTNEEGSRFQPGCMGSAVYVGAMDPNQLMPVLDAGGSSLAEALDATFAALADVRRRHSGGAVAAYVEAHIEQGPRLEEAGLSIGTVTGIQGSEWFAIEVLGEEAHAGTTPLKQRKDALKAACSIVGALEALMADETDTVRFTVGRFEVHPGSPNTVPGRVFFTIDFRHPDLATIDRLCGQIEGVAKANARGCAVSVRRTRKTDPTHFDAGMVRLVSAQAQALGLASMEIFSGAGHDAQYLARVCPAGMIFVPCAGGVSHNEAESATPDDLAKGARVLAACLVELADR